MTKRDSNRLAACVVPLPLSSKFDFALSAMERIEYPSVATGGAIPVPLYVLLRKIRRG